MKRLFFLLMITFLAISYGGKLYATTCAQAVVIPSTPTLPYVSALTCGTTNDITSDNSTTCGSGYYKGGWEAVYAWTPDGDYTDVSFSYTGQTWTGIFLYQGCPTSGGACIGNFTGSSSSKTLAYVGTNQTSGTKISLTSGVTYYIVIDTWPSPASPCPGTLTINATPPPPCSGTPDPGNTLSSANAVFAGENFILSLQNATPGTGVTYQWQSSTTGAAPWTDFGNSAPTQTTSITISTYYRCLVTCETNTGVSNPVYVSFLQPQMTIDPGSIFASMGPEESITTSLTITNDGNAALEWSGTVNLNPSDGPLAGGRSYCAASGGCDEYILRVQFGAIDHSSGCSNYANNTAMSTSVGVGEAYSIQVTVGNLWPSDIIGAWIDWDQNEVFDDGMIAFTNVSSLFTGNFTVPENATLGSTRLRIRLQFGGTLAPCGTTSWGEVEDYTVIVAEEPWVRLESKSGSVAPFGGTETVNVILDASKTPEGRRAPGETYQAEITFSSTQGVPSVVVPVTLAVADPNLAAPFDLTARFTDHAAGQLMLKWQYAPQRNAGLSHFIVTRDQMVIAQTKQLFCYDGIDVPGEYCYNVYAVYESGAFSLTAGEVCVPYPIPPEIPLSNWALILGALLIAGYAFFLIRKRM